MKENAPMREHRGEGMKKKETTLCTSNSTSPPVPIQPLPLATLHSALLDLACDLYGFEYDAEHADSPARRKKLSRDLRAIETRIEKLADRLLKGGIA
jgi:hypothetical protein